MQIGAAPERADVARLAQLRGLCGGICQHAQREGPVRGRDARAYPLSGIHRHCEGCVHGLLILCRIYHERQLQPVQGASLHAHADVAAGVLSDELYIRWRHLEAAFLHEEGRSWQRSM